MKKITLSFTEIFIIRITLKSKEPHSHEVFFKEKPYEIGSVDREDYEHYEYQSYNNFRSEFKVDKHHMVDFKKLYKLKFVSEYDLFKDIIPYLKVLFIHANDNHATQLHRLILTNIDLAFIPDRYYVSPLQYVEVNEYDYIKKLFPDENLDLVDKNAKDGNGGPSNLRCYLFYSGLLSQILFENKRWSSFLSNVLLDHPHYLVP